MKAYLRFTALILVLALCALPALAAGVEKPGRYLGTWEGGEDYGDTSEYYLELLDYRDGVYTVSLKIYRIWSFDDMTAILTEDAPSAVLATSAEDQYAVLGTLDFSSSAIELTILESDSPDLPEGTVIAFKKAK